MFLRYPAFISKRLFSTSLIHCERQVAVNPEVWRSYTREIPPYPYSGDPVHRYNNPALLGGGVIQHGNRISQGKNKGKSRRIWKLNIDTEKIWSDALQRELTLKVRRRVLRTIKKVGGLDNYLLGEKPGRLKELGQFGWKLRYHVMLALAKKFRQERNTLGLQVGDESFEEYWNRRKPEFKMERMQRLIEKEEEMRGRRKRQEEAEEQNPFEDEDWEDIASGEAEQLQREVRGSEEAKPQGIHAGTGTS